MPAPHISSQDMILQEADVNFIKQYGPLICTLAGTIGAPAFITAHPVAFAWVAAAAQFLHAVLPSIFETQSSVGGR